MKNEKVLFTLFVTLFTVACAHSGKNSSSSSSASSSESKVPMRIKGYGDFLFMPPGSIAIRNFVDEDGDQVDDRYQMAPGTKGYPMGHYYKDK